MCCLHRCLHENPLKGFCPLLLTCILPPRDMNRGLLTGCHNIPRAFVAFMSSNKYWRIIQAKISFGLFLKFKVLNVLTQPRLAHLSIKNHTISRLQWVSARYVTTSLSVLIILLREELHLICVFTFGHDTTAGCRTFEAPNRAQGEE